MSFEPFVPGEYPVIYELLAESTATDIYALEPKGDSGKWFSQTVEPEEFNLNITLKVVVSGAIK
jgi:hypothetical protein